MCDNRYGTDQEVIEVPEKDLMEKVSTAVSLELLLRNPSPCFLCYSDCFLKIPPQARQISIQNLQPFFVSEMFKANNFKYDSGRKLIIQQF